MVLPLIMRTTEEALMSVPDSFREGSFGLGAGRLRTVFKIIVPSAMPGILSGVILAIGRIVGETAALMYTAGTATSVCVSPMGTCRTLAVHMYQLLCEGREMNAAYATAVVLLVMVILSTCCPVRLQSDRQRQTSGNQTNQRQWTGFPARFPWSSAPLLPACYLVLHIPRGRLQNRHPLALP